MKLSPAQSGYNTHLHDQEEFEYTRPWPAFDWQGTFEYEKCPEKGETTKSLENNYFFKGFFCF